MGLQKGELIKLLPALPLRHHQPSHTISLRVRQTAEFLLGHISGSSRHRELTLEEGDLQNKALCILMSKRRCCGVLHPLW
jgi:hypothetical protein